MTTQVEAARLYVRAQAEQSDEAMDLLADALADDVAITTPRGTFNGKRAFLEQLANPALADSFRKATWGEPRPNGGTLQISGRLAPPVGISGYEIGVEFAADGRIASVVQAILPGPPLPPSRLHLDAEMKQTINDAWRDAPFLVACAAANGQPLLSLRGTVQVYGEDCLAFWARNITGGTLQAIEANPRVTLLYRNGQTRTNYTFYGRGWITKDEQERWVIFDNSPPIERVADPDRRGVAVMIEIDEVEGSGPRGRIHMVRDGAGEGA
jgi:hypothetical protein